WRGTTRRGGSPSARPSPLATSPPVSCSPLASPESHRLAVQLPEDALLGGENMLLHGLAGLVGLFRGDGGDDGLVLLVGLGNVEGEHRLARQRHVEIRAVAEALHHVGEQRRAADAAHFGVQLAVELAIALPLLGGGLAAPRQGADLGGDQLQAEDVGGLGAAGGQFRHQRLAAGEKAEEVVDLLHTGAAYPTAHLGHDIDEALEFQAFHGVHHRLATGAELLGDILDGQPVVGAHPARQQQALDVIVGFFGEAHGVAPGYGGYRWGAAPGGMITGIHRAEQSRGTPAPFTPVRCLWRRAAEFSGCNMLVFQEAEYLIVHTTTIMPAFTAPPTNRGSLAPDHWLRPP